MLMNNMIYLKYTHFGTHFAHTFTHTLLREAHTLHTYLYTLEIIKIIEDVVKVCKSVCNKKVCKVCYHSCKSVGKSVGNLVLKVCAIKRF